MSAAPMDLTAGATQRRPSPVATSLPPSTASHDATVSAAAADLLDSPTAAFPPDASLYPGQARSLAGIATRAFCLGACLSAGVLLTVGLAALPHLPGQAGLSPSTVAAVAPLWRLPFFAGALAAFHFAEFYTTAAHNTPAASVDAFLLTANWPAYAIAHTAAFAECLLHYTLFRKNGHWAWWPTQALLVLGLVLVAAGQAVRFAAMVQAGRSFNHQIQHRRARSHALVTSGIYAHLRHPSYFGFFWWALGTQLVLGNVVCLVGYTAVLWCFFSARIRHEERLLVRFFGDEYVAYRARVGTKMPYI